jgi:hypothetical protein
LRATIALPDVADGAVPVAGIAQDRAMLALTILGTLFAMEPLLGQFGAWGFDAFTIHWTITEVYTTIAILLGLAIYCYSFVVLLGTRRLEIERLGNILHATALIVPIAFAAAFSLVSFVDWALPRITPPAPLFTIANLVTTLASAASALLVNPIARRLKSRKVFGTDTLRSSVKSKLREARSAIEKGDDRGALRLMKATLALVTALTPEDREPIEDDIDALASRATKPTPEELQALLAKVSATVLPGLELSAAAKVKISLALDHAAHEAAKKLKVSPERLRMNLFAFDAQHRDLAMIGDVNYNMPLTPERTLRIPVGYGSTGRAFAEGRLHIAHTKGEWTGTGPDAIAATSVDPALQWIISVPVMAPDEGKAVGVLNLDGKDSKNAEELQRVAADLIPWAQLITMLIADAG